MSFQFESFCILRLYSCVYM